MEVNIFESFVESTKPFMINSIWRILRHPELCKDVLQETLTAVWQNFYKIQNHPNPRALVIKISDNKAYDHLRKVARHLKNTDLLEQDPGFPPVNFEGAKKNLFLIRYI